MSGTNFSEVLFPVLYITSQVDQDDNNDNNANLLLSFKGLQGLPFSVVNKQNLYNVCVKSFFAGQLRERGDTKWRSHLSLTENKSPSWRLLYKNPLPKRSGDLQWRILHCALPTKVFLFKCEYSDSSFCNLCNEPDTVFHVFCECCKLSPLLSVLDRILSSLGIIFSKTVFIFGCKYSRNMWEIGTFSNFLFGQAKLAIWKAHRSEIEGQGVNMVNLFRALVESRIRLEYEFNKMNGNLPVFERKWCVNKSLTFIEDEDLFFIKW